MQQLFESIEILKLRTCIAFENHYGKNLSYDEDNEPEAIISGLHSGIEYDFGRNVSQEICRGKVSSIPRPGLFTFTF